MKLTPKLLFIFLLALSGCATPVYRDVFKEKTSYNYREFNVPANVLFHATTRAICSKNFIIEKEEADKGFILAKRSFQRGKKSIVLVLQAKMDTSGRDKTLMFLTALQTTEMTYVADHTRFFLFVIPLPGGGGKNASQIKEGEKVIDDKGFYKDFFNEIESQVSIVSAEEAKETNLKTAQLLEKSEAVPTEVIPLEQPKHTATQEVNVTISNASSDN